MVKWWEAVGKFRIKRNRKEANISKKQWVKLFEILGIKRNKDGRGTM